MNFDFGTIIAIAAALLFYLRLIVLQRQKLKVYRTGFARHPAKRNGKTKTEQKVPQQGLIISNKFLVIGGVLLVLLGAAAAGIPGLNASFRAAWWLLVSLGILLMSLGIR